MKTAVLLVTWNGQAYVKPCLDSILGQALLPDSLWVVDNASADNTVAELEAYDEPLMARGCRLTITRNSSNLGFTKAANQGLRQIMAALPQPELAILLNQDTVLNSDWLQAIQDMFHRYPNAGAVGCRIFYPDGLSLQHAGGFLERPRMTGRHYGHHQADDPAYHIEREVDFVTGAAMAVRVRALEQTGLFNEIFCPGYYEDVDLCVRLKAHGWSVMYCPGAVLRHVESASFASWDERWMLSQRNRLLFAAQLMSDSDFRREFKEAEMAFLRDEAQPGDLRALALAYGRALLMLGPALKRPFDGAPLDGETLREAIGIIATLRRACVGLRASAWRPA